MLQSFKLALKSIWGNKMRSFLTMLGIIIGVAAVIILVSLVNGYMGSVVESFASMGVNQINVNVTNLASRSLDVDQMYAFYEEHTDLFGELSPNVTLSSTIKYGDDSMTSTSVAGRSEQYLEIKSYELETGRNIAYSDIVSRQKVCVIGAYVANELYGSSQNAIGRTLKIDGYAFKIIGVAEAQDADNMEDGGTDDFVWIPYSVAVKMSRNANITNYTFTALDTSKADECTAVIKNFLYETFKDEDLYRVTAMSEMLDSLKKFRPDAQIWVGTIVVGKECEPYYLDPVPLKKRGEYNAIIHQCVEEAGDRVHLVDLSSIDGVYETVNGTHPNKKGMTTFAQAWYEAMKDSI